MTITRKDLFPGYQLVQSVHVAVDFMRKHVSICDEWARDSNSIITLAEKDLESLEKLSNKLTLQGHLVERFYEPDIENQLTAICILADCEARKKLAYLPLALKELGR